MGLTLVQIKTLFKLSIYQMLLQKYQTGLSKEYYNGKLTEDEKMEYIDLLSRLESSREYLDSAIACLDSAQNATNDAIIINGIAYKREDIRNKREQYKDKRSSLINVYIPEVEDKINEVSEEWS